MVFEAHIIRDKVDINKVIDELMKESSSMGGGALVSFIGFVKDKYHF